ncbi:MAG TPA: hypothetical protein VKK31_09800 [Thermoanaerobaculia bacterium]|nr:hypothetical protein [Thermoanaerobaculia bacterium]
MGSQFLTDFNFYAKPEGVVTAVMIFVDFGDACAGSSSPDEVARHMLGNGHAQQLFRDQSYQKMTLDVTVRSDLGWRRMPECTTAYQTHGTSEEHRKYLEDAARLFSAEVKFSDYALVLVATPGNADLGGASSFTVRSGHGAQSVSGEVRLAVTFDQRSHESYVSLVHEMGHLFGLPDLYPLGMTAEKSSAGSWSVMSDRYRSSSFLGFERYKNGWLNSSRTTYIPDTTAGWSATLHPLSNPGGLSMIVLPVDQGVNPSKVFVIELAQPLLGLNGQYWGDGVLLYTVDATIPSGSSPVVVIPKTDGHSPDYGNLYMAPCRVGESLPFSEGVASGILTVVQKLGSSYEVKIDYKRS